MTTNFPTSVDSFPDPLATDRLDNPPHDVLHTNVNSAVEAIETALLDGAPLHIDDVNERVGVGTTSPSTELEVDGTVTATEFVGDLQGPTHIRVKNTSGGSLSKGTPVYATGSVGASGAVEVQASLAGTASTMPALGLLDETLADNAQGSATIIGVIRQMDTSSYSVNDSLYVAVSGGLTNVRPTGASELVQKIGRVVRADASTGEVLVLGAGRSNDVPNNIVAGGLTIDTDTLHVDSTNDRVGIGTASPAYELDVNGRARLGGAGDDIYVGVSGTSSDIFHYGGRLHLEGAGNYPNDINFHSNNDGSYWHLNGPRELEGDVLSLFHYNGSAFSLNTSFKPDGKVGIGTNSPSYTLDANGDINAQGYLRTKGAQVGMALVYAGSLGGGTSTFLNVFGSNWTHYRIIIDAAQNGNTTWTYFRFVNSSNTAITSGYYSAYFLDGSFGRQNGQGASVAIFGSYYPYGGMVMDITGPHTGDHPSFHISSAGHDVGGNDVYSLWAHGYCATTSDITGIQFYNGAPYGSVKIYGVA